jgi:hypothetical protein
MRCLRIYATPDGESHFDEGEMPTTKMWVHPDAMPFEVSASYKAPRVCLTRIPAGSRCLRSGWMAQLNTRQATERCATFRRGASFWWKTHTARAISHAIPQRRKPSSG